MKLRLALLAFVVAATHLQAQTQTQTPTQIQRSTEVPSTLFGIELDGVYEYSTPTADSAAGTLPVKRLLTSPESLHRGLSLYFEPLTQEDAFPYDEFDLDNGERISSYRVFVYPVIPDGLRSFDDLPASLPQRVIMIEWSRGSLRLADADGYRWARDLCSSIEAELGMPAQITDIRETDIYRCVFTSGDRELEVNSALGQTIQLSLDDEISTDLEADVYMRIWRLDPFRRANRLRPAGAR